MKESYSEHDLRNPGNNLAIADGMHMREGDLVRFYHTQVEISRKDALGLQLIHDSWMTPGRRVQEHLRYRNDCYCCEAILLESFETAKEKLFSIKNLDILRLDIVRVRALFTMLEYDPQMSLAFDEWNHAYPKLNRMIVGDIWLQVKRGTTKFTLTRARKISDSPI